jgi:hypothetical protein
MRFQCNMPAQFVTVAMTGHRRFRGMAGKYDDPVDLVTQAGKVMHGRKRNEFAAEKQRGRIFGDNPDAVTHKIEYADAASFIGDSHNAIEEIADMRIFIDLKGYRGHRCDRRPAFKSRVMNHYIYGHIIYSN